MQKLKRSKQIIVVVFLLSMNTLLGVSIGLLGILPLDFGVYSIIYLIIANVVTVFDFVLYWQLSRRTKYTNGGRLWRVLAAGASVLLVVGTTLQFAIGFKVGMRGQQEKNSSPTELPVDVPAADGSTLDPED